METIKAIINGMLDELNRVPMDKQTRLDAEKIVMTAELELKAAEEALEKQTAKKVEYIDRDCSYFDCPECGTAISYMDEIETHKYCLNCGQKLEWVRK